MMTQHEITQKKLIKMTLLKMNPDDSVDKMTHVETTKP